MKILLIEDDHKTADYLQQGLSESGYVVDRADNGVDGLHLARQCAYDLIILDVNLPQMDGWDVLASLREHSDIRVMMLTARGRLTERVKGFDLGADDYLLKPFEFRELLARMRAVVRRRDGAAHSLVGSGALQLDLTTREVVVNGAREALTAREFALLHALLERPGAILSREQLENRIYGWGEEVTSNAIDVLIHGMRRKLGADAIRNVRGLGWRVAA